MLGDNVVIEEGVQLCYSNVQKPRELIKDPVVYVGSNTVIRSGCVIHEGVTIGKDCILNHYVIIRSNTHIGDGTSIGDFSKLEGDQTIGKNCSIWTHAHLTAYMTIGDNVFIGPCFNSLNDPAIGYKRPVLHKNRVVKGPTICDGARISGNVTLQPGVVIGKEAIIGTGSVVTRDIPEGVVAFGAPAKGVTRVTKEHYFPEEECQ